MESVLLKKQKRNFILKNIGFALILIAFVLIAVFIFIKIREGVKKQKEIDILNAYIERNVMLGHIVGVKLNDTESDNPENHYVNVRIDNVVYTIESKKLYNEFLYENKETELFIVYFRITPISATNRTPKKIEKTIFSIYE